MFFKDVQKLWATWKSDDQVVLQYVGKIMHG